MDKPASWRQFLQIVIFIIALIMLVIGPYITHAAEPGLPTSPLVIESAGARHGFTVELATTPEEQSRGLMFRKDLPRDRGMLFIFPARRMVNMWMKNTLIPLDMLFIDTDGTIIHIANAKPQSLDNITSMKPVNAVLELAGGTSKRLGIKSGDKVRHAAFKP